MLIIGDFMDILRKGCGNTAKVTFKNKPQAGPTTVTRDYLSALSGDMLWHILDCLSTLSVLNLHQTNHKFNELSDAVWRNRVTSVLQPNSIPLGIDLHLQIIRAQFAIVKKNSFRI
jgi:hypothetical protein